MEIAPATRLVYTGSAQAPCRLATFVLGLLTLSAPAQSQSVGRELENAVKDVVKIWTSPAETDKADLVGLVTLTAVSGVALLVDEPLHAWLRAHPRSLPVVVLTPLREGNPLNILGRSYFLASVSGALYLAGWTFDERSLRDAGRGCASGAFANTIARHFTARLLGRLRPRYNRGAFVIKPLAWGDWPMRSFPGGHGANVMTCATFWSERFDLGAAEPVLYALASSVALARVVDEAHWTSDTVFGLGFGYAVGREVARLQNERSAVPESAAARFYLVFEVSF